MCASLPPGHPAPLCPSAPNGKKQATLAWRETLDTNAMLSSKTLENLHRPQITVFSQLPIMEQIDFMLRSELVAITRVQVQARRA